MAGSPLRHAARGAGEPLPLRLPAGRARQVVTVIASRERSTTAVLSEWQRDGTGWRRVSPSVPAWLGRDGMTRFPSESRSATPEGSFALTQAFGREPDPGTALAYRRTTPADWWISQAGPLYNTLQHCVTDCPFAQGSPNEHLYEEMPFYQYAVVIDYNRHPVRQGAGSAFFVHVTVGAPTQGCISIARERMVQLLRWLKPSAHPRILIGTDP
jgi:L,D-peptidoglycan transpeptidase YkuD (ErfK/YbiS/YcfS/YnhG family)